VFSIVIVSPSSAHTVDNSTEPSPCFAAFVRPSCTIRYAASDATDDSGRGAPLRFQSTCRPDARIVSTSRSTSSADGSDDIGAASSCSWRSTDSSSRNSSSTVLPASRATVNDASA
jgi:hypothetical protein